MFPDYLQKVDKVPLLAVAAGLVFLCQLVAMVLVVDSQVEKAQIRDAQNNSVQMATADCSENYSGPVRSRCIEQVNAELSPYSVIGSEPETQAVTRVAEQSPASPAARKVRSLIQAAFANRQ